MDRTWYNYHTGFCSLQIRCLASARHRDEMCAAGQAGSTGATCDGWMATAPPGCVWRLITDELTAAGQEPPRVARASDEPQPEAPPGT